MSLSDRRVVLGVSGSIAAYKAAEIASRLVQGGALVDTVLTEVAQRFVTPLTFRSLTSGPVFTSMFEVQTDLPEEHVAVGRRAELIVIAPASATTLARLAHGMADDFISLICLASKAPLLLAPAMDSHMWEAEATQENVTILRRRGAIFVGPDSGHLASGHLGIGRLADPSVIVDAAKFTLSRGGDLQGRRLVISAGGTREPIDPVRFISNRSSGKMGYALAEAARDRGADVDLISTVSDLSVPYGVHSVNVDTVSELRTGVLRACEKADALIMAAAVSDFRTAEPSAQKLKKTNENLTLALVKNENFFPEVPSSVLRVGFAAETEDLLANAQEKLAQKALDLICANDVTEEGAGFGSDNNRVVLVLKDGSTTELPLLPKYEVAQHILDRVQVLLENRDTPKD